MQQVENQQELSILSGDKKVSNKLDAPLIYVACLSSHNCGIYYGVWIDATQSPEDIQEEIESLLSSSPVEDTEPCEEWAIHDYQGFLGIEIHEYESIETISQLANAILQNGQPFASFYEYFGYDNVKEALEKFPQKYQGTFEDKEDFTLLVWSNNGWLALLEEAGIDECYIDFAAYTRDLEINEYTFIEHSNNEIFVFSRH